MNQQRIALYVAMLGALVLAGLFGYRLQISSRGLVFEPARAAHAQDANLAAPLAAP